MPLEASVSHSEGRSPQPRYVTRVWELRPSECFYLIVSDITYYQFEERPNQRSSKALIPV